MPTRHHHTKTVVKLTSVRCPGTAGPEGRTDLSAEMARRDQRRGWTAVNLFSRLRTLPEESPVRKKEAMPHSRAFAGLSHIGLPAAALPRGRALKAATGNPQPKPR